MMIFLGLVTGWRKHREILLSGLSKEHFVGGTCQLPVQHPFHILGGASTPLLSLFPSSSPFFLPPLSVFSFESTKDLLIISLVSHTDGIITHLTAVAK